MLAPKSPAARHVLDDAFAQLERRPELWDVLLDGVNTDARHRGADEEAFRLTYPFSPALVSTLRSLAGIMQRERTALKVMQKMLVDRRDTVTVNDVIPVGDAFDDIVEGQEPLDHDAVGRFRAASALYRRRLRPLLLAGHGLGEDDVAADPTAVPPAFVAEERLAKTLLLSAVAPDVPALKDLTASRLASLNHGSIVSPLPGGEGPVVLAKIRSWASRIPEIQIGDEPRHPVIRMRLAEVNYESVVDRARGEDNDGRRRELVKQLVHEALGVDMSRPDAFGAITHRVCWRGSAREVDLVFGNVRDSSWLTEDHFRNRAGTWRFVIDYPFDDDERPATEDLARIDQMKASGFSAQTVVWLPRYLSAETMRQLRRLVVLEWLFTGPGDRWASSSDHLAETGRMEAKAILASQRSALRSQVQAALQQAYGAAAPVPGVLVGDVAHDRVLDSFDRTLGSPAEPVGADLRAAFANLVDQAFTATFPAHPRFEPGETELRTRELATVATYIEKAVADRDGRVPIEAADRAAMRRITGPLRVGSTGETHYLFGDDQFAYWTSHLERAASRAGVGLHDPVTVGRLRSWINAIKPAMGLRPEVADVVVCAWASSRQRAWYDAFGAAMAAPRPGAVRDDLELRPERMPTPSHWEAAVRRAGVIFGVNVTLYLTSAAVGALVERVRAEATPFAAVAVALAAQLSHAHERLGLALDAQPPRLATARAAAALVDRIGRAGDRVGLVAALADRAGTNATDEAVGKSLKTAADLVAALADYRWDRLRPLFDAARTNDQLGREAAAILQRLSGAVWNDEIANPLRPALTRAEDELFSWITTAAPAPQPGETNLVVDASDASDTSDASDASGIPDPNGRQSYTRSDRTRPVPAGRPQGTVVHRRQEDAEATIAGIRRVLTAYPDADIEITWRVIQ